MKKICKLLAIFIGLLVFGASAAVVSADSSNVTVTWTIPADVSLAITYPTGEGAIEFAPGSKTFVEQEATSQTEAVSGMHLENQGNTALQINFVFDNTWDDAGLTFFNASKADNTNASGFYSWTNSNETSANTTVIASLAVSGTEDFWFWSSGTDMLESAVGEDLETLKVYYVNA